jgi:predicted ATP-dependent serine protease
MSTKYCPECGAEYQEWAVKCLDCGVALVDEKPNFKKKPKETTEVVTKSGKRFVKEPLVAIESFATSMEAQFSQGILEAEGVPSIIADADNVMLNGSNTSTKKGVALVVKESDLEKAKEILGSIMKEIPEGEFPEDGAIEEVSEENMDEDNPETDDD